MVVCSISFTWWVGNLAGNTLHCSVLLSFSKALELRLLELPLLYYLPVSEARVLYNGGRKDSCRKDKKSDWEWVIVSCLNSSEWNQENMLLTISFAEVSKKSSPTLPLKMRLPSFVIPQRDWTESWLESWTICFKYAHVFSQNVKRNNDVQPIKLTST